MLKIVIFLENTNHPAFKLFSQQPSAFCEESGEISLSILARTSVSDPQKSDSRAQINQIIHQKTRKLDLRDL